MIGYTRRDVTYAHHIRNERVVNKGVPYTRDIPMVDALYARQCRRGE